WVIALAALVLIVGIVLLRRGLKGIALDDHPICRRCGFDLFGLPGGVAVCSECGADLSSRRAIRIGTRKRRPGIATLGALLIVVIVFNLGVLGLGMLN